MSTSEQEATVIPIEPDSTTHKTRAESAGKAPATHASPPVKLATAAQKGKVPFLMRSGGSGISRGLAAFDFLLRIVAFGATLAAAIATGTSAETLGFFTQFFQFRARFDDFPAFTFFVVGNALAAGYLVLSLPFSAVTIMRPLAGLRLLLLIFDLVVVVLITAAASSAASIVYLAHKGNARANWVAICMQFNSFCERTSGAVVGSFIAVVIFMLLIVMSAVSVRKH